MKNLNYYETLYLSIVLEDNHEAFKKLFYEFYPSLCVFAGRYISSSETCEDVVQDVFFNIWKNRKSLNIHSSFRNFLVTSVRNKCTDYLRKQSSHKRHMESYSLYSSSPSPDDIYTINELEGMLKIALDKLPPNVQTAFSMSRIQKMTYNEIAAEMDVSPKTVEGYISQALKLLREDLKDYLLLGVIFTHLLK